MPEKEAFEIRGVRGYEILDSRGRFTVRACVRTKIAIECADAPSGASKSTYEARELIDEGTRVKRVTKAVTTINTIIAQALVGMDVRRQRDIDEILKQLDGTENFSRIGGNAAIAVSIAVAKTAARGIGVEVFEYIGGLRSYTIPVPLFNLINGGLHGAGYLDIQEFLVVPLRFKSFKEALVAGAEIREALGRFLQSRYGRASLLLGDEGGFSPPIREHVEALDILAKRVEELGYTLGGEVYLGLDVAATNIYDSHEGVYKMSGRKYSREELIEAYVDLARMFKLLYIEDPFIEDDLEAFAQLQQKLPTAFISGDDVYATNTRRLRAGCEKRATRAAIVKPNQIGTLTDAIRFAEEARRCGNARVVSHRSGDTEDHFIADFAVGLSSEFVKAGAPSRGERTSKYNRLVQVEEEFGLGYAGTAL